MKTLITLILFSTPCIAVTQCADSTKITGVLFMSQNVLAIPVLQFNLAGKPQVAFKDETSGGFKYTPAPNTIINDKDISFSNESRLKVSFISNQSMNGICTKIVMLEKGLKLNVSANINCSFQVNSAQIQTPSDIVVAATDTKYFSTSIEGFTYKFELNIDKLAKAPQQLLEQQEDEIKKIIIRTMKPTAIEASLISKKNFKLKNIFYQLSN